MAFFFHSSAAGRVVAFYPSPLGATESLLDVDDRVLEELEPDVEAVLVNRARGARQHFLVPIEDAYRLVGLIRIHWRGLSGGTQVWDEIERFFAELAGSSKKVTTNEEVAAWRT
jgi:hypothetical protein